jgi:hypothetical protein
MLDITNWLISSQSRKGKKNGRQKTVILFENQEELQR